MIGSKKYSLQNVGLFVGISFLLMTILLPAPENMSNAAWHTAGIALLLATWWATEAIPFPVTSLLPILLFPAFGILSIKDSTVSYADPIIFLLLGGFIIATGLSKWNLHRRLSLNILNQAGSNPNAIIAAFMGTTAFISIWISNTAATIMMIPIALSLVSEFASENVKAHQNFTVCLLLGIAYGASIGGFGSIIGSPPNAFVVSYLADIHNINISFIEWMMVGIPVVIVMTSLSCLILIKWAHPFDSKLINISSDFLTHELNRMGKISLPEKRIAIIFLCTISAWILRVPIQDYFDILKWLDDTLIAVIAVVLMFIVPSGHDQQKNSTLLSWENANTIPWGILLLMGGGLSLSVGIQKSGLATWLSNSLPNFSGLEIILVILCIVAFITFLTELTSNTATMTTLAPILSALAVSNDIDLKLIFMVATMAVSYAFMLPVGTPPNAIVFATEKVTLSQMIKVGFKLNLMSIVTVTLLSYLLIPLIFSTFK